MSLIRTISAVGVLALLTMTLGETDFELYTESHAEPSTSAMSVTCVSPGVVAFSPNVAYTISIPAPTTSAFSASSVTATAALTNAVNGDTNPTVSIGTDAGDDAVVLYHRGPYIKIGGVQCSAATTAKLDAYGDGVDDTAYDVSVQETAVSTYQSDNRADNKASGTPLVAFGTGGSVATSNLSDGSDADTYTNGEISFGGASSGGFRLFNRVVYLQANPDTRGETITWVFTPN